MHVQYIKSCQQGQTLHGWISVPPMLAYIPKTALIGIQLDENERRNSLSYEHELAEQL